MNQSITPAQVAEAVTAVQQQSDKQPTIGLILGSGLSGLADAMQNPDIISSDTIPHWPTSTVAGHQGRLILGPLQGKTVLVLQGRAHYYEGYTMSQITLPVRVMHRLGVKTLIVTNAAGGINSRFSPGDVMLIKDHINLPGMAGRNPLRGPNDDKVGPRFPDMTQPYNPNLRQLAHTIAAELGFSLQEGVYGYVAGPSYETPAELRLLQIAGADAVGMSTVPSVIVARHAGMRVIGLSTITNMALPDPAPGTLLTHEEVLATGKMVIPRLTALIHTLVKRL
jgi:purine-nucleoside phosphorylase